MDFVKFIDPNKNTNGSRARNDYEEIINSPRTHTIDSSNHSLIFPKRRRKRQSIPSSEKFDKKRFFIAAMSDDIHYLEKLNFSRGDINTLDQFGWSALMMASCAGSFNAVRFLLSEQVDITVCDGGGNTALSLADAKHHEEISKMIREKQSGYINKTIDNDEDVIFVENETFDCSICQRSFSDTTQKQHEASTVHLFNVKNKFQFSRRYHIPDSNVGFRMMIAQGWDRESGLGPKDREGKIYPVKTTLRKNRTGLGVKQTSAKITHFSAFDPDAVKWRPPVPKSKTKHDLNRESRRNRQKEIAIRKALS